MTKELKRIMDYLEEVAKKDSCLATKLADRSIKTPEKMFTYITAEAKKLCEKGSNCVVCDDDTVFQWARHYWLDYEEKETPKKKAVKEETDLFDEDEEAEDEPVKVKKVKVVEKKNEPVYKQMSIFDF